MRHRLLVVTTALAAVLALVLSAAASAEAPQLNTPASISGNANVGEQLTANNGTWLYDNGTSCHSECEMTYQWQRCDAGGSACSDIAGSSGRFYTVQSADAGSKLRAMETMSIYDCGAHNTQTGTIECNWTRRSAPSGMTAVVRGSAPAPSGPTQPTTPTVPAAPKPQAPLAPVATSAPTVSGLAMVEETLAAARGSWTGSPTLALQWQRCDAQGQNCTDLGLSGDTYTVIAFDIGKTLRVRITASNGAGARDAVSEVTSVVSELKPTEEKPFIAAAKVVAPHRLVVDQVTARPAKLTKRRSVTVALRVSDDRGFRISGALVSAVVRPGTALLAPVEATTDEEGLVSLVFTPGSKLNLKKPSTVTLVVTARRPGDKLTSPRAAIVRVKVAVRPAKPISKR
jgi:hypothetical protein